MAVTIKKVARRAGVSPSTVSRVLSGYPNVGEEVSRKVKKAAEELGYTPNSVAKSLVTRSASCLCVILPKLPGESYTQLFFTEVIRGMVTMANAQGFDILVSTCANEQEELQTVTRLLEGGRVDGVILLASREEDAVIDYLEESRYPFVLVGRSSRYSGILSVDTDNVKAAYDATRHLISMGHKRIGFIGGPSNLIVSSDRLEGYSQAMREKELEQRPEWIIKGESVQDGYRSMAYFMDLPGRPSAVVAMDDMVALNIIRGLNKLGFQVPNDLAIVSLSSIPAAAFSIPSISSMDTGIYHLGYRAAQVLIGALQSESGKQPEETSSSRHIVPHQLHVRESSLPAIINNNQGVKAVGKHDG